MKVIQFFGDRNSLRGIVPEKFYVFENNKLFLRSILGHSIEVKSKDYLINIFNRWFALDYSFIKNNPRLKKLLLKFKR